MLNVYSSPNSTSVHNIKNVLEARGIECDVAVYGGTPAGVTAAIQAARAGKKAVLLSFNQHVGGMTSGGLTATDLGKQVAGL